MAWQIPISTSVPGVAVSLAPGDDVFVGAGVIVASTANLGITGSGSGHEVLVYGTVASALASINLGSVSNVESGNLLTVKPGGHIQYLGTQGVGSAVQIVSFDSKVVNEGSISAPFGGGIFMVGDNPATQSEIVNSGTVEAIVFAIAHTGSETLVLTNSGLISGGMQSFFGSNTASDLITNTGRMVGNIELGGGNDVYNGASGRLSGEVLAGDGNDTVIGGIDNDRFEGGNGNDSLSGNAGNDTLNGAAGNDVLTGGGGKDILIGGTGRDFFDFNSIKESVKGASRDIITDFNRAVDDRIDLRTIDAQTGGGNQNFKFIGTQDFHDKKGELRYEDKGSKVIVQGDVNGDGKADFEIYVAVGALSRGDFFL
jgi:Ca2+-binding RTX toxin-like protein